MGWSYFELWGLVQSTFYQVESLRYCLIKANESMFHKTVFVAMNSNPLYYFVKMYLVDVANLNSNYMISTTNIFAIFISFLILSLILGEKMQTLYWWYMITFLHLISFKQFLYFVKLVFLITMHVDIFYSRNIFIHSHQIRKCKFELLANYTEKDKSHCMGLTMILWIKCIESRNYNCD